MTGSETTTPVERFRVRHCGFGRGWHVEAYRYSHWLGLWTWQHFSGPYTTREQAETEATRLESEG